MASDNVFLQINEKLGINWVFGVTYYRVTEDGNVVLSMSNQEVVALNGKDARNFLEFVKNNSDTLVTPPNTGSQTSDDEDGDFTDRFQLD